MFSLGLSCMACASLTTTMFKGNMFQITNGWGVTYDTETNTITFDSGITGDLRKDNTVVFTLTFTSDSGESYVQTLSCN